MIHCSDTVEISTKLENSQQDIASRHAGIQSKEIKMNIFDTGRISDENQIKEDI